MGLVSFALAALLGAGSLSAAHFVGDDGQPFALRPPVLDLTPSTDPSSRALFFLPRELQIRGTARAYDAESMQGIPINDTVTNVILFTGGAALLGTIIADFLRHH